MKLFIFNYYPNAQPTLIFADNAEQAVNLLKESIPDFHPIYYKTYKEVEVPNTPTILRGIANV